MQTYRGTRTNKASHLINGRIRIVRVRVSVEISHYLLIPVKDLVENMRRYGILQPDRRSCHDAFSAELV